MVTPNSFTHQYFPNINIDDYNPFPVEVWGVKEVTKPQMSLRQNTQVNSQYWEIQVVGKITNWETFGILL